MRSVIRRDADASSARRGSALLVASPHVFVGETLLVGILARPGCQVGERASCIELGDRVRHHEVDGLELSDRLAEGAPFVAVANRDVERRAGATECCVFSEYVHTPHRANARHREAENPTE